MHIGIPKLVFNNNQISYEVDITCAQGNRTLWYSLDNLFLIYFATAAMQHY